MIRYCWMAPRMHMVAELFQLIVMRKWKSMYPYDKCWWMDNDTLSEEDYWFLINRLRDGKWWAE